MATSKAAKHGEQARQQLLRAAAELIGEIGWSAVSTRAVAERAGIGPGLVHYHFESVQALLREAAIAAIRDALAAVRPVLDEAADGPAGAHALLDLLASYTGRDAPSLVFIEAYLACSRDEQLRLELAHVVAEFRHQLAGWLAAHGHDRPAETAAVLAATLDGLVLHRGLDPELTATATSPVVQRMLEPQAQEEKASAAKRTRRQR